MITDEMVEKAIDMWTHFHSVYSNESMRAALEAVAPQLIAQGMREAAKILDNSGFDISPSFKNTILTRAQELDPE